MKALILMPSVGLFVWSCFSVVFIFEEGDPSFLLGLICLFFGFGQISWYANPALFGAWFLFSKAKFFPASVLGLVAVVIGFSALGIEELPRNEAGHMTDVLGFQRGYYLWMAAHFTTLLASTVMWLKTKTTEPIEIANT